MNYLPIEGGVLMESEMDRLQQNFEAFLYKSMRDFHFVGKHHSISISQIMILEILHRKGPTKISEFADRLDITLSAITSLSDNLLKSGYVTRERCDDDRRVVRLVLTEDGQNKATAIRIQRREIITKIHNQLSPEEQTLLFNIYEKVISD